VPIRDIRGQKIFARMFDSDVLQCKELKEKKRPHLANLTGWAKAPVCENPSAFALQ